MSDLRTAAQQALEAMEYHVEQTRSIWKTSQAIDALRDALAQQTQTPCDIAEDGVCEVIDCCRNSTREEQEPTVRFKCTVVDDQHPNGVPFEQWLNAPQQEPVAQMRENALARWAHAQEEPPDTDWQRGYEAARRWVRQVGLPSLAQQDEPKGGGNLPPPLQAEPVEEPVAWRHKGAGHFTVTPLVSKFPEWEPLYTHPPRRAIVRAAAEIGSKT